MLQRGGDVNRVLIFDVNETLSDLSSVQDRLAATGAGRDLFTTWFAGILRDGFALAAAGGYADFGDLARDGLRSLLPGLEPAAVDHVVDGFAAVGLHADVPAGIRALHSQGFRLATMTNGNAASTERLLRQAGVRDCFEALLDVAGPRHWKPHPHSYAYALEQLGATPTEAALVAVHPWDVHGAQSAGLRGIWLRRGTAVETYPSAMLPPTLAAEDVGDLAQRLEATAVWH